jgi:hypothetical protein
VLPDDIVEWQIESIFQQKNKKILKSTGSLPKKSDIVAPS